MLAEAPSATRTKPVRDKGALFTRAESCAASGRDFQYYLGPRARSRWKPPPESYFSRRARVAPDEPNPARQLICRRAGEASMGRPRDYYG